MNRIAAAKCSCVRARRSRHPLSRRGLGVGHSRPRARGFGAMSSSEDGPWSNVVPAFVDGRGEALSAARDLAAGARLLRVAPLAAVPYADALDARCGG